MTISVRIALFAAFVCILAAFVVGRTKSSGDLADALDALEHVRARRNTGIANTDDTSIDRLSTHEYRAFQDMIESLAIESIGEVACKCHMLMSSTHDHIFERAFYICVLEIERRGTEEAKEAIRRIQREMPLDGATGELVRSVLDEWH